MNSTKAFLISILRLDLLLMAVLYPPWYFVYYGDDGLIEDLPGRFGVSTLALIFIGISYYKKLKPLVLEGMVAVAGLTLMAHLLYLTEINRFHQFYLLGTILAFFAITLSFISHRYILIYNFAGIALALAMDAPTAPMQKKLLLAVMVTLSIASYFTFAIRYRLIKSLEAERERFQKILDRLPVAAAYVSGDFLYMNENAEKLLATTVNDWENAKAWQAFIESHLRGNTLKTKNGEIKTVLSGTYRDKELQIWTMLDETEKLAARANMIHSAKLASLGTMAGGIAHEINNPLTIIKGYAEVLATKLEIASLTPEEQKKLAQTIVQTVNRIEAVVISLKKISRAETNSESKVISLKDLFNDVVDLCQKSLESRFIKLLLDFPSDDVFVKGQPVDLGHILINLINNSADAIKNKPSPWIELSLRVEGQIAAIRVKDSGPGISDEIIEEIFEPFFTTKGVGEGTGLGLSISKGLAKQNGGELLYDRNSKNTCFILVLPIAQRPVRPVEEEEVETGFKK